MESEIVKRNWGTYRVIDKGEKYRVKELVINPMNALSNQYHDHRDEVWNVVEGSVRIVVCKVGTTDQQIIDLRVQDSYRIPKGHWHRAMNPDIDKPSKVVEIWYGDTLTEDDITREGEYH